jgi:CBS-domain-containing membrane protein
MISRPSEFLRKLRGRGVISLPAASAAEVLWSLIGAFIGIASVSLAGEALDMQADRGLLIGSYGASAVLLYGAWKSPLAQPRNLVGGHLISALVGVACWKLLGETPWLAESVAVALAIAAMHLTRTLHPPGGATALIAVMGSPSIHQLGWWYVLLQGLLGPLILLIVALLFNNLAGHRHYPDSWW